MHMGLQIRLQPHRPEQRKLKRYDESCKEKFDYDVRDLQPTNDEFRNHRLYYKNLNLDPGQVPQSAEAAVLADVNLRSRGKIGLALGSMAKCLISSSNFYDHRDLDVLVLNPHARDNPAPNEWGIDWWIRPRGLAPTNGRVSLWYDIALNNNVACLTKEADSMATPLSINFDQQSVVIKPDLQKDMENERQFIVASFRKDIETVLVPAGLYIPDPNTMGQIVQHCNVRARESGSNKNYDYLNMDYKDVRNPLYPVLPHELVKFKPL